jgi:hypothetical protein
MPSKIPIAAALAAVAVTLSGCAADPALTQHAATSSVATTTALSAVFDTVDRLRAEAAAQQGFGYVWGAPEVGGCGRVWLRAPNGAAVNVDSSAMYSGHGAELKPGFVLAWGCSSLSIPGATTAPVTPTAKPRVAEDARAAAAKGYGYEWLTVTGTGNPCVDVHVALDGATYSFPAGWLDDVRLVPAGGHALRADPNAEQVESCTR